MNFRQLNEELKTLYTQVFNEDTQDFESILKQTIERLSNGDATKGDKVFLKELNKSVMNKPEFNSAIYNVILGLNNDITKELINMAKRTDTYDSFQKKDIDMDKIVTGFKGILTDEAYNKLLKDKALEIAECKTGQFYTLWLFTQNKELCVYEKVGLYSPYKIGTGPLYTGWSVDECIKVIESRIREQYHTPKYIDPSFVYILQK